MVVSSVLGMDVRKLQQLFGASIVVAVTTVCERSALWLPSLQYIVVAVTTVWERWCQIAVLSTDPMC